jgi:hypothetical protein
MDRGFANRPGRIVFGREDKVIVFEPFPFDMFYEHTERQIGKGHDPEFPIVPVSLSIVSDSISVLLDRSVHDKHSTVKQDLFRAQSPPFPRAETRSQAAQIEKVLFRVSINLGIEKPFQFLISEDVRSPEAFSGSRFPQRLSSSYPRCLGLLPGSFFNTSILQ